MSTTTEVPTMIGTVTAACDDDNHGDCHDHDCVCGCHVLFALIGTP